jgi:hypothetical protein
MFIKTTADKTRAVKIITSSPYGLAVTPGMATVASVAIILISRYITMVTIGVLTTMFVAVDALEGAKVIGYVMAIGANIPLVSMISGEDREILGIVIPCRRCPGGCSMAILAGSRESHNIMIRGIGVIEIGSVAGETIGRCVLIAVSVTSQTLQRDMRAVQRELRVAMIECSRRPGGSVMALSADMIEIILHVVGIGDILIIGGMTGITIGRRIIESRRVAGGARLRNMRAGQGKLRLRMIECGRCPG